ncbi:hypothetical protein SATRM34S_03421 [Streptomyces atroolivaceus]
MIGMMGSGGMVGVAVTFIAGVGLAVVAVRWCRAPAR